MNKFLTFNRFLNWSLKILLLILVIPTVKFIKRFDFSFFSISFLIGLILLSFGAHYSLKNKVKKKFLITFILIVALILRILWFFSIDSIPIGDFNRMFICAGDFLGGTSYMFKGTAYMGRFPHMSITVLYFALIRKVFSNPLVAIRFINIVFSMFNVVLLFLIAKEVFEDEDKSIWVLFLSALYPPMILYNNVYCSENMAMPLFLLSVLLFLKAFNIKGNKSKIIFILLSGLFLSLTQLFRPIGYLMIVAYIMFILIYFKENIKTKILISFSVIGSFIVPFIIVSYILIGLNITEYPLWHGTEPPSISMLKGTNIKSGGRWNEEDSKVFNKYDGNYEKVDKEAKKIIKERLTKTPFIDLFKFYKHKYIYQWKTGDFSGSYWAEDGLDEAYNKQYYLNMLGKKEGKMVIRLSEEGMFYFQTFFAMLMLLSYIGLYRNRTNINPKIDLFYIIFCGISLQCLLIESQDRYTYPFSWLFIILAITAFSNKKGDFIGGEKWIH